MGFIFFIMFLVYISRLKRDNRGSDLIRYGVLGFLLLSILSSFWFVPFGGIISIGIIIFVIKKILGSDKNRATQRKYDAAFDTSHFNGAFEYQANTKNGKNSLPQSVKKRKKIIKEFSEKNDLFLTDEQINGIANASYMSNYWKAEIMDMQQKYEVIYEWFRGYTGWLRAYMYVFRVQEISSDFTQQQKIVAYAFNEVFNYSDTLKNMPLSMRIKRVNEKFFTNFDDITFMIAYRFLEERGIKHDISEGEIVNADKDIDDLLNKYKVDGKGAV